MLDRDKKVKKSSYSTLFGFPGRAISPEIKLEEQDEVRCVDGGHGCDICGHVAAVFYLEVVDVIYSIQRHGKNAADDHLRDLQGGYEVTPAWWLRYDGCQKVVSVHNGVDQVVHGHHNNAAGTFQRSRVD